MKGSQSRQGSILIRADAACPGLYGRAQPLTTAALASALTLRRAAQSEWGRAPWSAAPFAISLPGVAGRSIDENRSVQCGRTSSTLVEVKRNRSNDYYLRFAGSEYSEPLPMTLRLRNETTVPGARLPAVIRRRPVPVNT